MERLRDSLTTGFLKRIENALGQEATLQLLWPYIVGSRLAANAQLKSIRGSTLIVSVPDRSWQVTLRSLDNMILDAVNRWVGEGTFNGIEFPELPRMARAQTTRAEDPGRSVPGTPVDHPSTSGCGGDPGRRAPRR